MTALLLYLGLITSLWLHELAHVGVALLWRDPWARRRWTLRPFVNLDPLLSFVIPAVTTWLFGLPIGLGRPLVTRQHRVTVSLAGPAVNLLLAAVFAAASVRPLAAANLMIGLFNLLPMTPLDGGHALAAARYWWRVHHPRRTT